MIYASRNPVISILPAHRNDLEAIMLLERSSFRTLNNGASAAGGGELLGEGRTILIARAQHPVGVISIKTVGELADLHRLVVDSRSRRRGIGTDLVRAGLEVVRQPGCASDLGCGVRQRARDHPLSAAGI